MKDYSHLFRKPYCSPSRKLGLIRRVLRSKVCQSLMLAAIMMIVDGPGRK